MQYFVESIKMYAGEKRSLTLLIHSKKDEDFVVRNASIEIKRHGKVVDNPTAQIDGHEILFLIDSSAYEVGRHDIVVIYEVAAEKRKARFTLEVM